MLGKNHRTHSFGKEEVISDLSPMWANELCDQGGFLGGGRDVPIYNGDAGNIAQVSVVIKVKATSFPQAKCYSRFSGRILANFRRRQNIFSRDSLQHIADYIFVHSFAIVSIFIRLGAAVWDLAKRAFIWRQSLHLPQVDGAFSGVLIVFLRLLLQTGCISWQVALASLSWLVESAACALRRFVRLLRRTRLFGQGAYPNTDNKLLLKRHPCVGRCLIMVRGILFPPKIHMQQDGLWSSFGNLTIQIEPLILSPEPLVVDNSARGPPR